MRMLLIAWILLAQAAPQAQRTGGFIEGTVVRLGTGEPLAGASVRLNLEEALGSEPQAPQGDVPPPEEFHRVAKADAEGRFFFQDVLPGRYRLIAIHDAGYVPAEYGQRSPTAEGSSFEISPGQRVTGVQLALAPTGSISGRVYDSNNEPLGYAQVMALRPVYKDGRRTLTIVQIVTTDDRGEYRLFWLPPGTYYVAATPEIPELAANLGRPNAYQTAAVHISPPMRFGSFEQATTPAVRTRRERTGELIEEMYLPVYYPGTTALGEAAPIVVPAGSSIGGIDLSAEMGRVPARHVRGRIIDGVSGQPVAEASVSAVPQIDAPYVTIAAARTDSNGAFDLAGVAPGSYRIHVSRYGEGRTPLSGVAAVDVGGRDVENLSVIAIPEFRLFGAFIMESGSRSYPRIGTLIRDPDVIGSGRPGPSFSPPPAMDGSFVLDGIGPGDFRITIEGIPPDGYIKSMRLGTADVLNDGLHLTGPPEVPLEIVIGANAGTIAGFVVDSRQQPVANCTVVLVPDFRLRHRADLYKVVSTDAMGGFRMQGITPGSYKLFAWDRIEPGAWQDPDVIDFYEAAARPVYVYEGTSEGLRLELIP